MPIGRVMSRCGTVTMMHRLTGAARRNRTAAAR
jgi:hypothetical protein